jgi:hypothetical protein
MRTTGTASIMVGADETRPETGKGSTKARASKSSSKSAEKRRRKSTQDKPEQRLESAPEAVAAAAEALPDAIEPAEQPVVEVAPAAPDTVTIATADVVPVEPEPAAVASAEPTATAPVSVRTIADAYGAYTRKSIEQTSAFFAQLAGSRSLDRALELQSQFARSTFETFVDESRRIRELHRELAKERLRRLEGFVMGRRGVR